MALDISLPDVKSRSRIVPSGTLPPYPAPTRPANGLFRPPPRSIPANVHIRIFSICPPPPAGPPPSRTASPAPAPPRSRQTLPVSQAGQGAPQDGQPEPRVTPSPPGRQATTGGARRRALLGAAVPGSKPWPERADGEHLTRLVISALELANSYPPLGGYGVLFDEFGQCGLRLGWRAQNQGRVAIIKGARKVACLRPNVSN